MQISLKIQGADALLKKLQGLPKLQERALVNALNVIGRAAQKEAKKGIQAEYNIKSADLSKAVDLIPARTGAVGKQRLFVMIDVWGSRLQLYKFGARPVAPKSQKGISVQKRKPVSILVRKSQGRHPVHRSRVTGYMPFLAKMKSGHTGIFVRTEEESTRALPGKRKEFRKPQVYQMIRELTAEGLPAMFKKRGGDAMRKWVREHGADILREKIMDQIKKHMKT
ncbi:MAG: hypothetical protein WC547_06590 [Candidatus Omnitrophota bacterium]